MVDLCGCRKREVEFGREVHVKVEVFFRSCCVLALCGAEIGEGRGGGHHEEGEGLRTRGIEWMLLSILDVVGMNAGYRIEESGIVVACHGRILILELVIDEV